MRALALLATVGSALGAAAQEPPAIEFEPRWLRRPASSGIENAYRDHLVAWAVAATAAADSTKSESADDAARRWAAFEALVIENIARAPIRPKNYDYREVQRGFRCIAAIEENTVEKLAERDPELLLAVATFHVATYLDQLLRQRRYWLSDLTWQRLESLRRRYRDRRGAPEADEEAALALYQSFLGGRLASVASVDQMARAREAFALASRFAPEDPVARYWLAFLDEKLGRLRRALEGFTWLQQRDPRDAEVALRVALLRARLAGGAGARDFAKGARDFAELAALARNDAEDWIRVLAFEEAARRMPPAAAIDLLREARRAFPAEPALAVQLASLLPPTSPEAAELLAVAAAPVPPTMAERTSPRHRYEQPRTAGLEARMRAFAILVERRLGDLVATLRAIEADELARRDPERPGEHVERPVFVDCHNFKPR